jgi:diguanylate cyclase (GGDEF)-like protein/PAS domain S-box-containing protein
MAEQSVLIVDDNSANRQALADLMEAHGLRVIEARGGDEALRRAREARPHLILLDVLMPGIDGIETCRMLRADPATQDIPVIFMTALSAADDKVAGFAAGCVDYITKPFQIDEVAARVKTHLELYALRAQLQVQNEDLRRARDELETRVLARTAALARANDALREEIRERRRAQAELEAVAEQIRDLYNNAPCGYHSLDADGRIVQINDTELVWLGYARDEILGTHLTELLTPEGRQLFAEAFPELKTRGWVRDLETQLVRKDGTLLPVLISASAIKDADGNFAMSRSTVYDISERKRTEQRIRYLAHHDALTGLPNRALFQDRVDQLIRHAHRRDELVAVMILDLDQFKHVNDSLGHHIGDQVLQAAATRLGRSLRDGDTVARWGGDEFVISVASLTHSDAAALVAHKVLESLQDPFLIEGHELHVGASVGISIYPTDGRDVPTLMRAADTAMYHAKQKGRGSVEYFTPALSRAVQHRLTLATQLRQALARGELYLEYQPQVDLQAERVYGAEALVRWRHPDNGLVPPADFIPIAEETGMIQPIGEWVLREAAAQLKRWRDAGHADLRLAVNVSVRQFYPDPFAATVERVLTEVGLPPAALELEITESLLMRPNETNLRTLQVLNEMGVRLTVDDFGVGYSSLAYLQGFPVQALKIDRSFIARIGPQPHDGAIAAAVIAMARSLHLRVIAEGVENADQTAFLKARGCLAAQGDYFGPPVSATQFGEALARRR